MFGVVPLSRSVEVCCGSERDADIWPRGNFNDECTTRKEEGGMKEYLRNEYEELVKDDAVLY